MLPSSHCSPGSRCASPHIGIGTCVHAPPCCGQVHPGFTLVQSAEQPMSPPVVPSSHASLPSTTPSPQMIVDVHTWWIGDGGVGGAAVVVGRVRFAAASDREQRGEHEREEYRRRTAAHERPCYGARARCGVRGGTSAPLVPDMLVDVCVEGAGQDPTCVLH